VASRHPELVMTSATGQAVNRNTFNGYGWKPALIIDQAAADREPGSLPSGEAHTGTAAGPAHSQDHGPWTAGVRDNHLCR
jgi:hypothetical protein